MSQLKKVNQAPKIIAPLTPTGVQAAQAAGHPDDVLLDKLGVAGTETLHDSFQSMSNILNGFVPEFHPKKAEEIITRTYAEQTYDTVLHYATEATYGQARTLLDQFAEKHPMCAEEIRLALAEDHGINL